MEPRAPLIDRWARALVDQVDGRVACSSLARFLVMNGVRFLARKQLAGFR